MSWRKNAWAARDGAGSGGGGGSKAAGGSGGAAAPSAQERASKLLEAARKAAQTPSAAAVERGGKQYKHRKGAGAGTYRDPFELPALKSNGAALDGAFKNEGKGKARAVDYEDDFSARDQEVDEDGSPPPAAPPPMPSKPVTLHELLKLLTTPAAVSRSASGGGAGSSAASLGAPPRGVATTTLSMREAMPVAGKLFAAGFTDTRKLGTLSMVALADLGVDGEELRARTLRAIRGAEAVPDTAAAKAARRKAAAAPAGAKRAAAEPDADGALAAIDDSSPAKRARRRQMSPASIGREWGDVPAAGSSGAGAAMSRGSSAAGSDGGGGSSFRFHEVLDESALRGKYVVVNRAPVLTAWAVVLLLKLGFETDEALSLAQCYVAAASTARGVAIGVLQPPNGGRSEKEAQRVGTNQPHFELMGNRIPVMELQNGRYRGISQGEVVGPEKAWNYLRNSMYQTLPIVMGALHLLAESYLEPEGSGGDAGATAAPSTGGGAPKPEPPGSAQDIKPDAGGTGNTSTDSNAPTSGPLSADRLHRMAYSLYTEFRPETGGQWGRKATLYIDTILALRRHVVEEAEAIKRSLQEQGGQTDTKEGKAGVKTEGGDAVDEEFDREFGPVDWNPDDLGVETEPS